MNLKEFAARIGLSQTTVSRAMSGYPEVRPETRRRVLEAAEKLGYRPNISAQRLATGRADDVVTLVLSAIDRTRTPVLLAPAMNEAMWGQPATQRNVSVLRGDGFEFIGPDSGWQACRTVGPGRMAEPEAIFETIRSRLV